MAALQQGVRAVEIAEGHPHLADVAGLDEIDVVEGLVRLHHSWEGSQGHVVLVVSYDELAFVTRCDGWGKETVEGAAGEGRGGAGKCRKMRCGTASLSVSVCQCLASHGWATVPGRGSASILTFEPQIHL